MSQTITNVGSIWTWSYFNDSYEACFICEIQKYDEENELIYYKYGFIGDDNYWTTVEFKDKFVKRFRKVYDCNDFYEN